MTARTPAGLHTPPSVNRCLPFTNPNSTWGATDFNAYDMAIWASEADYYDVYSGFGPPLQVTSVPLL